MNAIRPMVGQGVAGGYVPPVQTGGAVPAVSPGYVPSAYVPPSSGLLRGAAPAPTMPLPGVRSLAVAGLFVFFALGCNSASIREADWTEQDLYADAVVGHQPNECFDRQQAVDIAEAKASMEIWNRVSRMCRGMPYMFDDGRKFAFTGSDVSAEETKGGGCWIGRARIWIRCKEGRK